ncbi:hypothetical protein EJ06DRAFT_95210 [Trichodelitschia bisporula]|uniref:Uncharacterized protein n=1 Tax=Trichodelitschia bisporula TaxID=703511 RepID=A0A6G1HS89_9PEZI|nr:hypothetical protein EJ06DRAFT_95210 [Trichodelitschia bisporula]
MATSRSALRPNWRGWAERQRQPFPLRHLLLPTLSQLHHPPSQSPHLHLIGSFICFISFSSPLTAVTCLVLHAAPGLRWQAYWPVPATLA